MGKLLMPPGKKFCIFVPHCSDLLTDHVPHGDGQVAYSFLRRLAERGHEVHVAAPAIALRHPVPGNLFLYPLMKADGSPLSRLGYMVRVHRCFRELRKTRSFDLIHQLNPVFTGISLANIGAKLPLVLGTYVARWPDRSESSVVASTRTVVTRAIRNCIAFFQQTQADILLLTTRAAHDRLVGPGTQKKVRFLYNGVDTDLFSPFSDFLTNERLEQEQGSPRVLFLANTLTRKGIFTLVEAWKTVQREMPAATLTIAGGGEDHAAMVERITHLGLSATINVLGPVEHVKATELYRSHAIYVLPSFGEPYGMSVVEAMACGRAIVCTAAGGVQELVSEEGGRKVATDNPEQLAMTIMQLLTDSALRRRMYRHNRNLVLSTMSWPIVLDHLESIYAELVIAADARGT